MDSATHEAVIWSDEELALLSELLESERTKLLVAIRRTAHRAYRDELKQRLTTIETMAERCRFV